MAVEGLITLSRTYMSTHMAMEVLLNFCLAYDNVEELCLPPSEI